MGGGAKASPPGGLIGETMEKIKLKFVGVRMYRSTDHVTKEPICAAPGATVDVSVEKADQLLRDFPKLWEVPPAVRGEAPAPVNPASQVQAVQERAPEPVVEAPAPPPAPVEAPRPAEKPPALAREPFKKKKGKGRR